MNFWNGPPDGDGAQEELATSGVTDGLPVVPPTRARVERMLELHGYDGKVVLTKLPPVYGEATWQNVAINAVMAGCRPEYLPIVGAAVEAIAAEEFNLLGIGTTTGSAAPLIVVNGPIAKRIGMNAAGNALGPGNHANATIGRALSLVLRNVGGAIPGELDMATLGQPAKYTCCFAENEAASPWTPLHVERGFDANASVVTVFGATGTIEVVDSVSGKGQDLARTYAQSMLIAGAANTSGLLGSGEPLIIMPPESTMIFGRDGYTKEQVKAAIYQQAMMPLEHLSPAVRERVMTYRQDERNAPLKVAERPSDIAIVVAGGVGIKAAYVPTWGSSRAVSRQIQS